MTIGTNLVIEAAHFAAESHQGQLRKYTRRPYIEHCMRVAGRLTLLPGVTETEIAAAWLHDVVEDCPVPPNTIVLRFGEQIGAYVVELTNPSSHYRDNIRPREDRKRIDRQHLAKVSVWAKRIKLLDRIDNISEMGQADSTFAVVYGKESLALAEALTQSEENKLEVPGRDVALLVELRNAAEKLLR